MPFTHNKHTYRSIVCDDFSSFQSNSTNTMQHYLYNISEICNAIRDHKYINIYQKPHILGQYIKHFRPGVPVKL